MIKPSPVTVSSLRIDVFSDILLGIFTGKHGAGDRLKVQHLASHYSVSSTPIREAIVELAGLGVVDLIPNRGAVVLPFGIQQIREILQVRRVLEVESARCACSCVNLEEVEKVCAETILLQKTKHDESWIARCVEIDKQAHHLVAEASGSSRLQAELVRYGRLMYFAKIALQGWGPYLDQMLAEHVEFLQAILSRDEEAAGDAMSRHMKFSSDRIVKDYFS